MTFHFGEKPVKPPGQKQRPAPLSNSAQAAGDPLARVEYTGNVEADAEAELSELLKGFRQRAKEEQERYVLATDSEFWFAVCFRSRDHKEAFLQALGATLLGDKYLDGHQLATLMGIELGGGEQ